MLGINKFTYILFFEDKFILNYQKKDNTIINDV